MCSLSFLKWGSIGYSPGIVQWDFTRRDHPGNPGRVSGSGPVTINHIFLYYPYTYWAVAQSFQFIKLGMGSPKDNRRYVYH